MSDELDKLNNSELSEAVAREVLGCEVDGEGCMRMPDQSMGGKTFESWKVIPPFAWSLDVVLPFVPIDFELVRRGPNGGSVWRATAWAKTVIGVLPVFGASTEPARAACIALIRAARAQKGGK